MTRTLHALLAATALTATPLPSRAQEPLFDLENERVLYCVGYAHLDTQWRWDFPTTIDRFVRDTLDQNFALFDKYPDYVFNFTGSVRYQMMREYYPRRYQRLKQHIADNRWFVSGSSVDEGDANVPSPESMIRQILYGNLHFKREFDRESRDFMLPDCFGFPASMPSIWAHCGLIGFSTQKLTWGSAVGIPFRVGLWQGPDGNSVIAALDPGPYVGAIEGRVDLNPDWSQRIYDNGERFGLFADYHYYGVGDTGGAPREDDVRNYVASMNAPDARFHVALTSSDQMYKDITPDIRARLPRYKGDLLLTEHSAGTLTSQAYMKRWNRKCENLADAAERAATTASLLAGFDYPRAHLERAWTRFLANQMHDILPGTSIPRAYTYSWNDEIIALNAFAATLTDATAAIASRLDTSAQGTPLVVVNPLSIPRHDTVEARIRFDDTPPKSLRVFDHTGAEVPSQILARDDHSITILFLASVGPNSWTVFDARPANTPHQPEDASTLHASARSLENNHLRIRFDHAGDIGSIYDKTNEREILAAPASLAFTYEKPRTFPAWNMDWADRQRPPIAHVDGNPTIRVTELGPLRVSLEITREARNSIFTQTYRLTTGDPGRALTCDTAIDWQSERCALKATFPLNIHNDLATYNWGLGTIQRSNNSPIQYEVPSHEWIDLSTPTRTHGVSILEDSKYASDKPAGNELRLTLLYTPGVRSSYLDQHSQDWGRHDMTYAVYPHDGDWRDAETEWRARRINQPLRAFQTTPHRGPLGQSLSLASVSTPQVDIRAIKRAEQSDHIIVRLQELQGLHAEGVEIIFADGIVDAFEVNGQERRIGPATVIDGHLRLDMTPYSPRSFALTLGPRAADLASTSHNLGLPFDTDVTSTDADPAPGAMDELARAYPDEMLPPTLTFGALPFALAPPGARLNALACRGQTIPLGAGASNRLHILAAATEDTPATFTIGSTPHDRTIQSWTGFVGQWDNRTWDREFDEIDFRCEGNVTGITPGFIKRDPIAWFATHRHKPDATNDPYRFSYIFRYSFPVEPGQKTLTLPDDPRIRIFAATLVVDAPPPLTPASPLYDDFTDRAPIEFRHEYPPPPIPPFQGVTPLTTPNSARAPTFETLSLGHPSTTDDARLLAFRYIDNLGNWRPHRRAGASGDTLPRLNDGHLARHDDDIDRCTWFDNQGRFFVDLAEPRTIESIQTYSWHRSNRAPQLFSLWGATGDTMPDATFTHTNHDPWQLIAVVDTRELPGGAIHASSITPSNQTLPPFRYLLWIAEDIGQGTFFTEIDIDLQEAEP